MSAVELFFTVLTSNEPPLNCVGTFLDPNDRDSWAVTSRGWFTVLSEHTWVFEEYTVTVLG